MNTKKIFSLALVFCLVNFSLFTGCKKSTPAPEQGQEKAVSQTEQATEANTTNPNALKSIIERRTSWNPILPEFYGKEMPDFQVTDITGKTHSLKDYRGKNVMVVMWATWCQPCMQEVPHLNTLRDIMPEDKLAILAISTENIETVKKTAQSKNMKYTVIATQENLPAPFSEVKGIPTAFYIRPDGTLKIVTEGSSVLGEMKSIISAE
ncbi:MAG: TlpA family protein disulfide reductase [Planctomycetaceae bacterium]|nr:TlpA family protein disulfide reductase [Planctomycetaceae bacterium]